MVVCNKGNAVFLDHTRAMEYAAKHHGIVVKLMGKLDGIPESIHENGYVEKAHHQQAGEGSPGNREEQGDCGRALVQDNLPS
jgi:hypothetical protein